MKKRSSTRLVRCYTLVEIMVSLAVFSILMLIMMQFFVNSQKLWMNSEARNQRYSDARVAMDVMASAFSAAFYAPDTTLMYIEGNPSDRDNIAFPVKMPIDYGCDAELYYIKFHLGDSSTSGEEDGALYLSTFSQKDSASGYKELFLPHNGSDSAISARANLIKNAFGLSSVNDEDRKLDIIKGVTSLEFWPILPQYGKTGTKNLKWLKELKGEAPIAVEIRMTMMDKASYDEWKVRNGNSADTGSSETPAARDFRLANEYMFSRIVYLANNR